MLSRLSKKVVCMPSLKCKYTNSHAQERFVLVGMIIEGDDGINSDHTTFIVSCCLQMVVLIKKNGLIVKMNGREGEKKTS